MNHQLLLHISQFSAPLLLALMFHVISKKMTCIMLHTRKRVTPAQQMGKANLIIWKKQGHGQVLQSFVLLSSFRIRSFSNCTPSSGIPSSPVRGISQMTHPHIRSGVCRSQEVEPAVQGCSCVKCHPSACC